MFPRLHNEPCTSEPAASSPKEGSSQQKTESPGTGKGPERTVQKCPEAGQNKSPNDQSSVDFRKEGTSTQETSKCIRQEGTRGLDDTTSNITEETKTEDNVAVEHDDDEQRSSKIVEHILKELKGINKIQEEISDLRLYLTSVRGSVDEVSCCVDAVLSEIGELYTGASASTSSQPSPVSQTPRVRRGSLGRQNAITSLYSRDASPVNFQECSKNMGGVQSVRHSNQWHLDGVQKTDYKSQEQVSDMNVRGSVNTDPYLELQRGQVYHSTSSISSCQSSTCPEAGFLSETDSWAPRDLKDSRSKREGWSEEDICSCANSALGANNCPHVWDTEDMQSSTSNQTSDGSEHLSLLFGLHHNSTSSTSSITDFRPSRLQTVETNQDCSYTGHYPYSFSAGYHPVDACGKELDRGPSRSLSCSTVLLTDCDDCGSSGHTLDLGSAESLDYDWTDLGISKAEGEDAQSQASSDNQDSKGIPTTPNVGFDVTTFSKAVLSFRSALKGALKKLEVSNPDDEPEASLPPTRQSSESKEKQNSGDRDNSPLQNTDPCSPKADNEVSVYMDCVQCPVTLQVPPQQEPDSCTVDQYHQGEPKEEDASTLDQTKDLCTPKPCESPLILVVNTDEVWLSPISENQLLDVVDERKPTDASHKERIANFQRILREKKLSRQRLSRSAQSSQGSHCSQGSQGSQSQDEFFIGIFKDIYFSLHIHRGDK